MRKSSKTKLSQPFDQ